MDQEPIQALQSKWVTAKSLPWGKYFIYTLIGMGVIAVQIFIFNRFFPAKPVVSIPTVMPEATAAAKVERIYIPGPERIYVYRQDQLPGKVPIPEEVKANKQNQFTSTAEIPKSPYGGTAVGFINMSTGKSAISYTAKERPLLGFGGKTQIGAVGGISNKGYASLLYLGQDIVRVGPVNVGVVGGVGTMGAEPMIGAGINVHGEF